MIGDNTELYDLAASGREIAKISGRLREELAGFAHLALGEAQDADRDYPQSAREELQRLARLAQEMSQEVARHLHNASFEQDVDDLIAELHELEQQQDEEEDEE